MKFYKIPLRHDKADDLVMHEFLLSTNPFSRSLLEDSLKRSLKEALYDFVEMQFLVSASNADGAFDELTDAQYDHIVKKWIYFVLAEEL